MLCLLNNPFLDAEEGREQAVKPSHLEVSQSIPLNFELVARALIPVHGPIRCVVPRATFHSTFTSPTKKRLRSYWVRATAVRGGFSWWRASWTGRKCCCSSSRARKRSARCSRFPQFRSDPLGVATLHLSWGVAFPPWIRPSCSIQPDHAWSGLIGRAAIRRRRKLNRGLPGRRTQSLAPLLFW